MRKQILLVDDESHVRAVVRQLLADDDHLVVEANNGAEALGLFKQGRFDLVMTDLNMPHITGNELAVQIRELAPSQPILMLTGHARMPGPDNPVDVVLRKPFGLRNLRETLDRMLSAAPAARPC